MCDPATERLRLLELDRRFHRRFPWLTPAERAEVYAASAQRCHARMLRWQDALFALSTMGSA
jgi:hypothetical protein